MICLTVTITAIASGPWSLAQIFAGTAVGVTTSPATPPPVPKNPKLISIEADTGNGATLIYVGDKNLPATGTAFGRKLAANASVQFGVGQSLAGTYVNASSNTTAVINLAIFDGVS